MKKFVVFFLTFFVAITAVVVSCDKAVKIPVSYSVESNHDTFVHDIFIPDSGIFDMQILVNYITGYEQDPVALKIIGLPSDISVTPDSFSAVPTYVEDFVFHTNHAAHGTYRVSIVSTAPSETSKTYTFNLTVIPADCATTLLGTITGHNACSAAGTTSYTATATATGTPNQLQITNFGGYGPTAIATVYLNCDNDSLTIPSGPIGNGATLSGKGTFTATGMVIYYTATSTPFGYPDNCVATFTK